MFYNKVLCDELKKYFLINLYKTIEYKDNTNKKLKK